MIIAYARKVREAEMPLLYELLQRCVVRIQHENGHGTGFFVAPGFVLTCVHVLHHPASFKIEWQGRSFNGNIDTSSPDVDLALVKVDLNQHPCVLLGDGVKIGDQLCSYGYSDLYPGGDTLTGECEGWTQDKASSLLKFKSTQVRPGTSGSPLLNMRTGTICGIIRTSRDRDSDLGGRAIPTGTVLRIFQDLKALQSSFHHHNHDWLNCLNEFVSRTQYLETVCRRYSGVNLPGTTSSNLTLQAVFQPLKLLRDPIGTEEPLFEQQSSGFEKVKAQERIRGKSPNRHKVIAGNVEDALQVSKGHSLVILGGPGTGKTTLLKYLMHYQAGKALKSLDGWLPIFISLPDFANSDKSLKDYLTIEVLDMLIDAHFAEVLWAAVKEGRAFICLDSLDEVEPKRRSKIIQVINEWAAREGCIYIVGSRFTDYKGGLLRKEHFVEWELQPMTPKLSLELAKHLLPELYQIIPSTVAFNKNTITNFMNALHTYKQATSWEEIPLLFSLAAVIFVRQGNLPPSRALLYQQVVDGILEARVPDIISREQLRSVLACFSLELYQGKGRTFTLVDMQQILPKLREEQHEVWDTEEMMRRIISSGLLEPILHNVYGFCHQTFQEYFVAVELARRLISTNPIEREEARELAWQKRTFSRWSEILRLMVGILAHLYNSKGLLQAMYWLRRLIEQRATKNGDPGDLGLELVIKSLIEIPLVAKRDSREISQIETQAAVLWSQVLLDAARNHRSEKRDRFITLIQYISQLYSNGIDNVLKLLVEALNDQEHDVEYAASEALKKLGNRLPIDALSLTLRNSHVHMRRKIIGIFESYTEIVPITDLFFAIHDSDDYIWQTAYRILKNQSGRLPTQMLLSVLNDRYWRVRLIAVEILEKRGEDVPIHVLIDALGDEDWRVRQQTIKTLLAYRERVSVEVLINALYDSNEEVRTTATEALILQLERVSFQQVINLIQDLNESVRRVGIQMLSEREEPSSFELLINALHDPDSQVRKIAVEVLGKQGERTPLQELINALHDPDSQVRKIAVEVLGKQGERTPLQELINALHDPDSKVLEEAVKALILKGEIIPVDALIKVWNNFSIFVFLQTNDLFNMQLANIPLTPLCTLLDDPNSALQSVAIDILDEIKTKEVLDILISYIKNKKNPIEGRAKAIKSLGKRNNNVAFKGLLDALQDSDRYIRKAAIKGLGMREDIISIRVIIDMLCDSEYDVIDDVLTILRPQRMEIPLELILPKLHDFDWEARKYLIQMVRDELNRAPTEILLNALTQVPLRSRITAIEVLGSCGDEKSLAILLSYLEDTSWQIQVAIIKAIGISRNSKFTEILAAKLVGSSWRIQEAVIEALGILESEASVEVLLNMLIAEDANIRSSAMKALLRQKNPGLTNKLVKLLKDISLPSYVKMAVINILGTIDRQFPLEIFIEFLQDNDIEVRCSAAKVLVERSDSIPLSTISSMLESSSSQMREYAIKAAEKLDQEAFLDILIRTLNDEDDEVRDAALGTLETQITKVPINTLLSIFEAASSYERYTLTKLLTAQSEKIPIDKLIETLHDIAQDVRLKAIEVIKTKKDEGWTLLLVITLLNVNNDIANEILKIIVSTEEEDVIPNIVRSAYKIEPKIKLAFIKYMENKRDESSVNALIKMLKDEDDEVKFAAIEMLGQMGEITPVKELIDTLHDGDWEVRQTVLEVLGTRVPIDVLIILLEDTNALVRRAATKALILQRELVPTGTLLMALYDADLEVRRLAIEALDTQWDDALVESLIELVGDSDEDVRHIAIKVLKKKAPEVLNNIFLEAKAILDGKSIGKVINSLTQMSMAEIIGDLEIPLPIFFEKLMIMLDWSFWQVRLNAIWALRKFRRNIPDDIIKRLIELRYDPILSVREAADDTLADILSLETAIEGD